MASSHWSSPTISRTARKTASSRNRQVASCSSVASPLSLASTIGSAASIASANFWPFSGSAAIAALTPAYIFSHTRGTPKTRLGRTSRK